jgi:hypothetical protein
VPTSIAGLTSGVLAQCTTVQAYNDAGRFRVHRFHIRTGGHQSTPIDANPGRRPGTDVVLVNYGASSRVIGKDFR